MVWVCFRHAVIPETTLLLLIIAPKSDYQGIPIRSDATKQRLLETLPLRRHTCPLYLALGLPTYCMPLIRQRLTHK